MSTTMTKRPLEQAIADARAFRDLFADCYEHWDIAGSVRRRQPFVGDVEHVVIAAAREAPGLFAGQPVESVNLMWDRVEQLLLQGRVVKHDYGRDGTALFRWGTKYRGVDFRGFNHELFLAQPNNLGPTLAIRTGPAEFSQRLVARLHRCCYRNHRGNVWSCDACPSCSDAERDRGITCPRCDGTGLLPVAIVPVADERAYFRLAGLPWTEPEDRR